MASPNADLAAYLSRILRAKVYEVAIETPLEMAPRISARLENTILFKREDLQPVFSFKIRGAYNKLRSLSAAELERGVICSSAGNHAQGVALAGRELGVRTVIVMPTTTPRIKVEAARGYGGEVLLEGEDYDAAQRYALRLAARDELVFVHPFDDPEVIAGQGTIGMEIHRQAPRPIDAIFVPIGGGGLIGGIGLFTKAVFPDTRIIGVEPAESASMKAAFEAGAPVELERVGIFADGVAVRRVGEETYRIARQVVDDILVVSTDEICAAIKDIFEDTRTLVEPAGAMALAGAKRFVRATGRRDATLVTVNCGANINFDRLRYVAERAALGERREALFAVEIPEERGSFLKFSGILGVRNVTEFNYRYSGPGTAQVFVGLEMGPDGGERRRVELALEDAGFPFQDMSDNELAKLHVRHLVGGKPPQIAHERLFRFEFPERPGALHRFLEAIGTAWNISLFHYRNHGSDYGRVLAGIQVPPEKADGFEAHLEELGYPVTEETNNPAYRMFLR
jgi:threonine dehydratase